MSKTDAITEIRGIIRREITRASSRIPVHFNKEQFRIALGQLFPMGDITTIWCEEAIAAEEDFFRNLHDRDNHRPIPCAGGDLTHIPEQRGPIPLDPAPDLQQEELL